MYWKAKCNVVGSLKCQPSPRPSTRPKAWVEGRGDGWRFALRCWQSANDRDTRFYFTAPLCLCHLPISQTECRNAALRNPGFCIKIIQNEIRKILQSWRHNNLCTSKIKFLRKPRHFTAEIFKFPPSWTVIFTGFCDHKWAGSQLPRHVGSAHLHRLLLDKVYLFTTFS